MKHPAKSTDIFNLRKMRKFFKEINPEDKDRLLVTIKVDNTDDRNIELLLSRLSVLLPQGYIIPPAPEAYKYPQYHFTIPHFHEMKKTYYQYKATRIIMWVSCIVGILGLIASIIAAVFSILAYLK